MLTWRRIYGSVELMVGYKQCLSWFLKLKWDFARQRRRRNKEESPEKKRVDHVHSEHEEWPVMGRDEPERNLERAWRWVVKGFIDWVMQLWLYLMSQDLSRYAPWNKSSIRWYYKNKLKKYHGKHCWTSQIFQYFHTPWDFQEIENMNRPFTSTEIESMLKKLPTDRSPGAEGLTREIHQTFREQLTPILLKRFLKIAEEITLTNSSYEATITLILPKPDKDNTHTYKKQLHTRWNFQEGQDTIFLKCFHYNII